MANQFDLKEAFDDVVADAANGQSFRSTAPKKCIAFATHTTLLGNDPEYRQIFERLCKVGKSQRAGELAQKIVDASQEDSPLTSTLKMTWAALSHLPTYAEIRYCQTRLFSKASPLLQMGVTG